MIEAILSFASSAASVISLELFIQVAKALTTPVIIAEIPNVKAAFKAVVAIVSPTVFAVEAIRDTP